MGRLRIKKKEVLIPFRETLAYRLMLITAMVIASMIGAYVMSTSAPLSAPFISAIAVSSASLAGLFYHLGRLKYARVSQDAMKRIRRKS